jgi:hypothetical protein
MRKSVAAPQSLPQKRMGSTWEAAQGKICSLLEAVEAEILQEELHSASAGPRRLAHHPRKAALPSPFSTAANE